MSKSNFNNIQKILTRVCKTFENGVKTNVYKIFCTYFFGATVLT